MLEGELSAVGSVSRRTRAPMYREGITVTPADPGNLERLRPAVVELVAELERAFRPRRDQLLRQRSLFRRRIASGWIPDFRPESRSIRDGDWTVAAAPVEVRDRRVEITGPTDRKMVVNALNSGASVYMADFEDAHSPVWERTLEGQKNLFDAIRREIDFVAPEGKRYELGARTATLMVRPRGWHLDEPNVSVDGRSVSASLFDVGVFLYQNARELLRRGSAPYLYLPKIEHAAEARLWNDVFDASESLLGLPPGSIRATVLIETVPAAFEMDEILYELRERALGLNCGRWDYIFSFIKQFRDDSRYVLPDRSQLTMESPFLSAYSRLLVDTCHRRGVHALGGMAADIPVKDDPVANARALERVTQDKVREVRIGHDGTWVAHPALVVVARAVFDQEMPRPNQIDRRSSGRVVSRSELLEIPRGTITESGVRGNVRVALRYLSAWLKGTGAVAIDHRMEDAATAEIARSQLWQWSHHRVQVSGGRTIDSVLLRTVLAEEKAQFMQEGASSGSSVETVRRASTLVDRLITSDRLEEFATIPASVMLDQGPEVELPA
jgi:malate synthase